MIYIGIEYIIADLFIKQEGKRYLSFPSIINYGFQIQDKLKVNNVDAIILISMSHIDNAISVFPDFFNYQFNENEEKIGVKLNDCQNIDDLKYHFIYRLPEEIIKYFVGHN